MIKKHPSILSGIKKAVENWKNVRIIISGREVPDMAVFSSFIKAEIAGVNTADICNRISDYDSFDPSLSTNKSYTYYITNNTVSQTKNG